MDRSPLLKHFVVILSALVLLQCAVLCSAFEPDYALSQIVTGDGIPVSPTQSAKESNKEEATDKSHMARESIVFYHNPSLREVQDALEYERTHGYVLRRGKLVECKRCAQLIEDLTEEPWHFDSKRYVLKVQYDCDGPWIISLV